MRQASDRYLSALSSSRFAPAARYLLFANILGAPCLYSGR